LDQNVEHCGQRNEKSKQNTIQQNLQYCKNSERQSARMSKITNDGLTWSGRVCFIVVPIWQ